MKPPSRGRRTGWRGFTLIELLTVIAIIAILAGLLFPVMNTVRANARKTQCINNLHQIQQAMKMYKDDWRVYPDALYGVAYGAPGAPFTLRLANNYVKDPGVFTCPNHPQQLKTRDAAKNPADVLTVINRQPPQATHQRNLQNALFSLSDSYDWQARPGTVAAVTAGNNELHYNLKWTRTTSGLADNPRQLVYKEPPDDTVISWCLYHSDMNNAGTPGRGGMAIVAFLSGRVQTIPAEKLANWTASPFPWEVAAKP
jgi:prepilin-type N-terminal cleavage/methylation domain-containing protein